MDLEQTATPPLPAAPKSHSDADLSRPGGLGPAIDSQTKNELRDRLKEIDEGLAVAKRNQDLGTTESLQTEREQIQEYLAEGFGIGGRPRPQKDPVKQARDRVSHAVRTARAAIKREVPALDRRLTFALGRGAVWSYRPESKVDWQL